MAAVMLAEGPENPYEGMNDGEVRQRVYELLGDLRSTLSPIDHGRLTYVVATRDPGRIAEFVAEIRSKHDRPQAEVCEVCGRGSTTRWCADCSTLDDQLTRERY
jgi:hypothetical protein